MPTLIVTAVFEGAATDGLTPGQPIPGVPVEVGGPGRPSVQGVTDNRGSAVLDLPEGGSWTVSATQDRASGSLLGLMTIDVATPMAMLALPVRWRPA